MESNNIVRNYISIVIRFMRLQEENATQHKAYIQRT